MKELEIAPDEQLIGYFEQHPAPLSADGIDLASPAAPYLGANGVSLLVPLVTQGRLVGLLSLGEPAGAGSYSRDDLAFLTTLAGEAAAAARIAQLLARQRADEQDRLQRPGGNVNGRGGSGLPNVKLNKPVGLQCNLARVTTRPLSVHIGDHRSGGARSLAAAQRLTQIAKKSPSVNVRCTGDSL